MTKMYVIFSALLFFISGCGVVEHFAGVGFDAEQFAKARQVKILELRLKSVEVLSKRLESGTTIMDTDISVVLDEEFLNRLLEKYQNVSGKLDEATEYTIKDVKAKLTSGSTIVSLELMAHNTDHNIDIQLMLDCLLQIESTGKELEIKLEPFNISPVLTTRGVYTAAKDIIDKLIKLNLANLNKNLPPLQIPVNIENRIPIEGSKTDIKSKINLTIINPDRYVKINLKIKEILFFKEQILIGLNLNKIEVE